MKPVLAISICAAAVGLSVAAGAQTNGAAADCARLTNPFDANQCQMGRKPDSPPVSQLPSGRQRETFAPRVGQQQTPVIPSSGPLRLMTPEIFNNSGLNKLSSTELTVLGNWITVYSQYLGQLPGAGGAVIATGGVIETEIDGEFKGWNGDTIYRMRNGQIWQQSSYHYHYHYAYSPEVLIYSSGGGYKIHVKEDDDEDVPVRRLK